MSVNIDRRIALIQQRQIAALTARVEALEAAQAAHATPRRRQYNSVAPRLREACCRPGGASQAELDAITNWVIPVQRLYLEKTAASRGLRLRRLFPSGNWQMYEPAVVAPPAPLPEPPAIHDHWKKILAACCRPEGASREQLRQATGIWPSMARVRSTARLHKLQLKVLPTGNYHMAPLEL